LAAWLDSPGSKGRSSCPRFKPRDRVRDDTPVALGCSAMNTSKVRDRAVRRNGLNRDVRVKDVYVRHGQPGWSRKRVFSRRASSAGDEARGRTSGLGRDKYPYRPTAERPKEGAQTRLEMQRFLAGGLCYSYPPRRSNGITCPNQPHRGQIPGICKASAASRASGVARVRSAVSAPPGRPHSTKVNEGSARRDLELRDSAWTPVGLRRFRRHNFSERSPRNFNPPGFGYHNGI